MMSRGLLPLVSVLAIITLVFVFLITIVVSGFKLYPNGGKLTFGEIAWGSLLRTLDPGTMGSDTGIGFRIAMLLVTLFGVVLVASLIGIISNALSSRIELLRKGKSKVLEKDHTLILGWNSKVIQIVTEIAIANQMHKHAVIVILADRDKVEMEEEIHRKAGALGKTRVVVRSGNPMSKTDLAIVDPSHAAAIVLLAPESSQDADSFSIKTCLALKGMEPGTTESCSIVGEIRNLSNLEAAELVSQGAVHWVLGEDLINRLIVQTCRQGGLSAVFTDLLDFQGSEIYLLDDKALAGQRYRDLNMKLETSVAIGVSNGKRVTLNPEPDYIIASGDKVIVIAEDDTKLGFSAVPSIDENSISHTAAIQDKLESTLILGANSSMDLLLEELDMDSLAGSKVVVINSEVELREITFRNIDLEIILEDPTKRQVLAEVGIGNFNHIIIVANRDYLDEQAADARTLLTLLHVRALSTEGQGINIVSEILDDHNRELAETTSADDFIVSDKIVSHVISQLAENKHLAPIFNELFSSEGSRITMVPVSNYLKTEVPVSFDTVIEAALRVGQSAIGYRLHSMKSEPGEMHGVRLNPDRKAKVQFCNEDSLVVLSNR
jgi:Trk K+ transport system NAD-binding subunit